MGSSAGPDIVASNRLVLNLDASDINSYPRSGTTWYDLSPYQNHGTLTNGPTHGYSDNGNHYIDFDGTNDYVDFGNDSSLSGLNDDAINTSQAFTFEIVLDAHATSLQCIMGMSSMQSNTNETQMSINNRHSIRITALHCCYCSIFFFYTIKTSLKLKKFFRTKKSI